MEPEKIKALKINKTWFYILSFTWGIMYTASGLIVSLFLLATGHKPHKWGWCWYFEVGRTSWGGAEWGLMFLTSRDYDYRIRCHEFGHAVQNCYLGPLMLPLVTAPSTLRYWYRRIRSKHGHHARRPYDGIWFEGQATLTGIKLMEKIKTASEVEK